MKNLMVLMVFVLMAALTGCGGGSSGPSTATGTLVDAPVAGVSYVSGSISGITGSDGSFTYEVGHPVRFFIGNITLGEIPAKGVVTPFDLLPGTSAVTDTAVTNMAIFLQTLDTGANPDVITIPAAARSVTNAPAIDWSTATADDITATLQGLGCNAELVSATAARDALSENMFNLYAGSYSGTYSGSGSGSWSVTVDSEGNITGTATANGGTETISGSISITGATTFGGSGGVSSGDTFTGSIDPATGRFWGTWSGGTFSGSKTVVADTTPQGSGVAAYAGTYSGTITGDMTGIWTITVSSTGTITGTAQRSGHSAGPVSGSIDASGNFTLAPSNPEDAANGSGNGTISLSGVVSGSWTVSGAGAIYLAGTKQ